jgi:hypothetical protein
VSVFSAKAVAAVLLLAFSDSTVATQNHIIARSGCCAPTYLSYKRLPHQPSALVSGYILRYSVWKEQPGVFAPKATIWLVTSADGFNSDYHERRIVISYPVNINGRSYECRGNNSSKFMATYHVCDTLPSSILGPLHPVIIDTYSVIYPDSKTDFATDTIISGGNGVQISPLPPNPFSYPPFLDNTPDIDVFRGADIEGSDPACLENCIKTIYSDFRRQASQPSVQVTGFIFRYEIDFQDRAKARIWLITGDDNYTRNIRELTIAASFPLVIDGSPYSCNATIDKKSGEYNKGLSNLRVCNELPQTIMGPMHQVALSVYDYRYSDAPLSQCATDEIVRINPGTKPTPAAARLSGRNTAVGSDNKGPVVNLNTCVSDIADSEHPHYLF